MVVTLGQGTQIIDANPSFFLLDLIRRGYDIAVISSSNKFSDVEKCWLDLIPSENIFLPIGENEECFGVYNSSVIAAWAAAFKKFGLKPPIDQTRWTNYKRAAQEQGVVTDPSDLLPQDNS